MEPRPYSSTCVITMGCGVKAALFRRDTSRCRSN